MKAYYTYWFLFSMQWVQVLAYPATESTAVPVLVITSEAQSTTNGMSIEAVITVMGICTALACFIIGLAWPRLRAWLSFHFKSKPTPPGNFQHSQYLTLDAEIFPRNRHADDENWWTSVDVNLPRYQDEMRRILREHYPDWVRFNQWVELRRAGASRL